MSLFDYNTKKIAEQHEPLAAKLRPRTLDEFWGQEHILAPGRLLRRAIEADQLSSLIFYGPPGTGKTTLARIIANTTHARFFSLNAVLAGIKDIRDAIEDAKNSLLHYQRKSILFIDEVHRFNKAQQDALLPWVENGTVVLIGATTENPYFEVNKALISRSRIFQLKPLEPKDLRCIAFQALKDERTDFSQKSIILDTDALDHLVNIANGDARALLNALELAVTTTPPNDESIIHINLEVAEESIQQRAVLYDKEGDLHFDIISAFIKSVRGSDPDAALYWLARMINAGESPNFILRRLLILACEDIGLADPNAVTIVNACAQAFDRIGLPEGRYHLAHATLYLATAPKSNSTMAFFDALKAVENEKNDDVPNHLKDANRDKALGHGQGYQYPHAFKDHWVAQQYLPDTLKGRTFYNPSNSGYEASIAPTVQRKKEAQLAFYDENLSNFLNTNLNSKKDEWIGRTLESATQRAEKIRDHIFKLAQLQENDRVLDLNASSGLLSCEAIRKTPQGGVFSILHPTPQSDIFHEQIKKWPPFEQPQIIHLQNDLLSTLQNLPPKLQFDAIIARNTLQYLKPNLQTLSLLITKLNNNAKIILAQNLPKFAPKIYQLASNAKLPQHILNNWKSAEENIILEDENNDFDLDEIIKILKSLKLNTHLEILDIPSKIHFTSSLFNRCFTNTSNDPLSYYKKLQKLLNKDEIEQITQWAHISLRNKSFEWNSKVAFIYATF